jgi:hypothetical protein
MDVLTDLHLDGRRGLFFGERGWPRLLRLRLLLVLLDHGLFHGGFVGLCGHNNMHCLFMGLIYGVLVPCWRRRHGLGPFPPP